MEKKKFEEAAGKILKESKERIVSTSRKRHLVI